MSQDIGGATAESPAAAGRKAFRQSLAGYRAVVVTCRSGGRLSWREVGERTGLAESTFWPGTAGEQHGIYDIRPLLRFADSAKVPHLALIPVILSQPQVLGDLMTGLAATPLAGGPDRG